MYWIYYSYCAYSALINSWVNPKPFLISLYFYIANPRSISCPVWVWLLRPIFWAGRSSLEPMRPCLHAQRFMYSWARDTWGSWNGGRHSKKHTWQNSSVVLIIIIFKVHLIVAIWFKSTRSLSWRLKFMESRWGFGSVIKSLEDSGGEKDKDRGMAETKNLEYL